ncbi:NAD(P)/FAD-dependent oxidoreductase [Flavobacterium stagni]|uniref:NAD(P)/FAD-dependent oxidoreductase n=1 Tax=Flavobacterium stagni TaxID=2506421 RepID=A0A4Q1K8N0_9FLAO|nr:FAD/NAD(P)-binding oxidoreductase [Flavobacterium stagni]RXR21693.1 NAD(P)/FAD-dependent oxidoreductase [Flavobacterium stagni]
MAHYQILIIGGGTAGIMVAAQLMKKQKGLNIGIIEPSENHYYQPAFTLVGAGTFDYQKTVKPTLDFIPKGVQWIKDSVTKLIPDENRLETKKEQSYTYDYLVVAAGLVNNLDGIEGLREGIESGVVCSNYVDPRKTWELLQKFNGGNAVFTQPTTPIKCGGAPQKTAYMSAHYFKKRGISSKTNVVFATPGSVIFGVKIVAETLMQVIGRYNIHLKTFYAPQKIDSVNKIIYFREVGSKENMCVINENNVLNEKHTGDETIQIPFDFLHLAPPQEAPAFLKYSELANEAGWMNVDHNSMQSNSHSNVFGLGDIAGLPTAKTGAAIRKQVPVVVDNLVRLVKGQKADNKEYNGYSSCPLVTGYGEMVLAEFNYKNEFTPDPELKKMLIFKSFKPHWRLWILKKYMLPYLYWNKMLKGEKV